MTDEQPPDRHGTYGEYQQHRKRGETPCDECKTAAAAYAKVRRSRDSEAVKRERESNKADTRALWRLAHLHPAQFDALKADEMRKVGLRYPLAYASKEIR